MNTPVGGPSRVKGLPASIDPNKPQRNYRDANHACSERIGRNGRKRTIQNIKASSNK